MQKELKKLLAAAGLAAAAAVAPLTASAAPIELALVVDASGSISAANWNLQTQAYANALANVLPTDGTVAVSVIRFGSTASVVRGLTTIDSASALSDLSSFFTGLSQSGNGSSTCISCGIFQANGTFSSDAGRKIIDVSTDGGWNVGTNPAGPAGTSGTSAWAVENGNADVVNAIGIGITPNFAYGPDSFNMTAPDFAAFESALTQKLRREIPGQVPVPGGLALIGIGLVGVAVSRRTARR
ncbi:MAG TPA: DUF1194 domain-containing protein [Burkholderiaceae bacterium]|nr:DUF1194 domain-containing protein [Burkholderiaceae bacterium]